MLLPLAVPFPEPNPDSSTAASCRLLRAVNRDPGYRCPVQPRALASAFLARAVRNIQNIVRLHRHIVFLVILDLLDVNGNLIPFAPLRDSCA